MRELGYDKDYEGLRPEDFEDLNEDNLELLMTDSSHLHLKKGIDSVYLQKVYCRIFTVNSVL